MVLRTRLGLGWQLEGQTRPIGDVFAGLLPRLSIPSNVRLNEDAAAPRHIPLFYSPGINDAAMLERYEY
jgi:hypothetical protein